RRSLSLSPSFVAPFAPLFASLLAGAGSLPPHARPGFAVSVSSGSSRGRAATAELPRRWRRAASARRRRDATAQGASPPERGAAAERRILGRRQGGADRALRALSSTAGSSSRPAAFPIPAGHPPAAAAAILRSAHDGELRHLRPLLLHRPARHGCGPGQIRLRRGLSSPAEVVAVEARGRARAWGPFALPRAEEAGGTSSPSPTPSPPHLPPLLRAAPPCLPLQLATSIRSGRRRIERWRTTPCSSIPGGLESELAGAPGDGAASSDGSGR
ncbi:unnamed protein product, partial [Urochloa humidicola]